MCICRKESRFYISVTNNIIWLFQVVKVCVCVAYGCVSCVCMLARPRYSPTNMSEQNPGSAVMLYIKTLHTLIKCIPKLTCLKYFKCDNNFVIKNKEIVFGVFHFWSKHIIRTQTLLYPYLVSEPTN